MAPTSAWAAGFTAASRHWIAPSSRRTWRTVTSSAGGAAASLGDADAIGAGASAFRAGAIAFGVGAVAFGVGAVAFGVGAVAFEARGVASGRALDDDAGAPVALGGASDLSRSTSFRRPAASRSTSADGRRTTTRSTTSFDGYSHATPLTSMRSIVAGVRSRSCTASRARLAVPLARAETWPSSRALIARSAAAVPVTRPAAGRNCDHGASSVPVSRTRTSAAAGCRRAVPRTASSPPPGTRETSAMRAGVVTGHVTCSAVARRPSTS